MGNDRESVDGTTLTLGISDLAAPVHMLAGRHFVSRGIEIVRRCDADNSVPILREEERLDDAPKRIEGLGGIDRRPQMRPVVETFCIPRTEGSQLVHHPPIVAL